MTEEEMEMQAEKREKDLIARTGRSRTAQGTWMPTKERVNCFDCARCNRRI